VTIIKTSDTNKGWNPQQPTQPNELAYAYQPDAWEPPTLNGQPAEAMTNGYFRWTRGMLRGIDFGGQPINTGQPPPP
jgi:hypothetical protein